MDLFLFTLQYIHLKQHCQCLKKKCNILTGSLLAVRFCLCKKTLIHQSENAVVLQTAFCELLFCFLFILLPLKLVFSHKYFSFLKVAFPLAMLVTVSLELVDHQKVVLELYQNICTHNLKGFCPSSIFGFVALFQLTFCFCFYSLFYSIRCAKCYVFNVHGMRTTVMNTIHSVLALFHYLGPITCTIYS